MPFWWNFVNFSKYCVTQKCDNTSKKHDSYGYIMLYWNGNYTPRMSLQLYGTIKYSQTLPPERSRAWRTLLLKCCRGPRQGERSLDHTHQLCHLLTVSVDGVIYFCKLTQKQRREKEKVSTRCVSTAKPLCTTDICRNVRGRNGCVCFSFRRLFVCFIFKMALFMAANAIGVGSRSIQCNSWDI